MPGNATRFYRLRLNWIGLAVLTGLLCSLAGATLLFAGAYEMERSKSMDWALIVGYILLLPTMLVGYAFECAGIPSTTDEFVGTVLMILIQLPWYVLLFWVFRKISQSCARGKKGGPGPGGPQCHQG